MSGSTHTLEPGDAVEVTLVNGEPRRGYIVEGPLEYIRHIGLFYQVGPKPPRNRNKTPEIFGTYAPEQIRLLVI